MPDLHDQIRSWADAHAPTEPAISAADVIERSMAGLLDRRRPHARRALAAAAALIALVGLAITALAVTGEDPPDRLRSEPPAGPTTARPADGAATAVAATEDGSMTVRLTLESDVVTSGSLLHGTVTIDNRSDPRTVTMCKGFFHLHLIGPDLPLSDTRLLCADSLTIPTGRSTHPVSVPVQHLSCDQQPGVGRRPCSDEAMLLPPGDYEAVLTQAEPVLPMPAPIPVRITS